MIQQDHLQVFDVILTTQSPLFIGSGVKNTKKEYLYSPQQNCVRMLDQDTLFALIIQKGHMDAYEQFMISSEDNSLWAFLTQTCGMTDTELDTTVINGRKLVRYRLPVSGGYDTTRELHPFFRDAYDRAYVPGSSLKGALRTAWLLHEMRRAPAVRKNIRSTSDFHNSKGKESCFPENQFTNRLRKSESGKNSPKKTDTMLDSIFRGIQVSDSTSIPNDQMVLTGCTLISPLSAATVSEIFDGHPKELPLYQECVRPGVKIQFRLTLDLSIINQHATPITAASLLEAIRDFDDFYTKSYRSHFPAGDQFAVLPQQPHLILGGHTGYFSKTLVYPYLEEHPDEALRWVQNYMMRKFRGKHDNDDQLGISPHRMRFVRYYGKFYPIGFCGVNIQ